MSPKTSKKTPARDSPTVQSPTPSEETEGTNARRCANRPIKLSRNRRLTSDGVVTYSERGNDDRIKKHAPTRRRTLKDSFNIEQNTLPTDRRTDAI